MSLIIPTFNKIDFKIKTDKSDKEGYYIMIDGSIHQEDATPVNVHIPKATLPSYLK